jgi:hypothetical protein
MDMTGTDTIGQVRVDIARLEGMVLQSLTDNTRRIGALEVDKDQLRTYLTAVNEQLSAKIAQLTSTVGVHTATFVEVRTDITAVELRQNAMLGKAMQVFSPLLALASFVYSIFVAGNHN